MAMVKNVGSTDKTVRLILGLLLVAFALFGLGLASTAGLIAAIIGVVLIVTGMINFCPAFKLLGISSSKS